LSDACTVLGSSGVLDFTPEVIEALERLHPPARPSENLYLLFTMGDPLTATPDLVRKQISTFRKGTADGLRAQHLTDALSVSTQDETLIEAITALVNLNLSGKVQAFLAPFIASAPLTALRKNNGGVRPIAIGEVWRRLVSKCANSLVSSTAASLMSPLQVGVSVQNGAEAIVHRVNHLVKTFGTDDTKAMVKIDFRNAFNAVSLLKQSKITFLLFCLGSIFVHWGRLFFLPGTLP
jgi:hypothetical protein